MNKLILIAHNVNINEEVMEGLKELEIKNYTKWDRVLGRGIKGGPHLDTPVWPGYNCVLAIALEEERVPILVSKIESLKQRFSKEGIKAFILPVEQII